MANLSITGARAPSAAFDLGRLILRLTVGVLMLLHGIAKFGPSMGFIVDVVTKAGLPAAFAYLVYVGEVLAPILLIIGLWTRAAALVVVIDIIVAIALVHAGELVTLNDTGGWSLELQGMYLFGALAIAFLGAGRYSLGGIYGRWN
ncbi:MAG TPA: DoxX family protein [Casimicrobiaceae bacterium]|jgi:putative oxidoreductase|nr:DoxX family protein [Casimicrobiaceae bacterium]HWD36936.1 DoxX family protein [Casimicrobiaceae bacterium]